MSLTINRELFNTIPIFIPPDEPPFFLRMATLSGSKVEDGVGWAASLDINDAILRSQLECVERTSCYNFIDSIDIDPMRHVNNGDKIRIDQISGVPASLLNLQLDNIYSWVPVRQESTSSLVWIPYDIISVKQQPGRVLRESSTTGCAIGVSYPDTLMRGLLEVLERHLFMEWYTRGRKIIEIHPSSVKLSELVRLLNRYRLSVRLFCIMSDIVPVMCIMAVLFDGTGYGPAVTTGLSAGFSVQKNAQKAIYEAWQPRIWLRSMYQGHKKTMQRDNIHTMADRGEYWWEQSRIQEAEAMLNIAQIVSEHPVPDLPILNYYECVDILNNNGIIVHSLDIPAVIMADKLHVVRVIAPQLLPVYFDEIFSYAGLSKSPQDIGPHFFL